MATAERLRDLTLRIYRTAAEYARLRGYIADTKFEFGFVDGELCWPTKFSLPTPHDSGPSPSTSPAAHSRPMTSSSFAISSSQSDGTNSLPRPYCPMMSSNVLARNIGRHTACLLVKSYELG